jgi:hypothetical protein
VQQSGQYPTYDSDMDPQHRYQHQHQVQPSRQYQSFDPRYTSDHQGHENDREGGDEVEEGGAEDEGDVDGRNYSMLQPMHNVDQPGYYNNNMEQQQHQQQRGRSTSRQQPPHRYGSGDGRRERSSGRGSDERKGASPSAGRYRSDEDPYDSADLAGTGGYESDPQRPAHRISGRQPRRALADRQGRSRSLTPTRRQSNSSTDLHNSLTPNSKLNMGGGGLSSSAVPRAATKSSILRERFSRGEPIFSDPGDEDQPDPVPWNRGPGLQPQHQHRATSLSPPPRGLPTATAGAAGAGGGHVGGRRGMTPEPPLSRIKSRSVSPSPFEGMQRDVKSSEYFSVHVTSFPFFYYLYITL